MKPLKTHLHWILQTLIHLNVLKSYGIYSVTTKVLNFKSICCCSVMSNSLWPHGLQHATSASVLPMNIQCWFPLGLTCLIFLQSKGLSRVHQHHSSKILILWHSAFLMVQFSHLYMTTGKTTALTRGPLLAK